MTFHLLQVLAIAVCFTPTLQQVMFTDPCTTSAVLSGPQTRGSGFVQPTDEITNGFCDISIREGWYRLKVDNRDVDLATSAPPIGACNTVFPIWMNGQIPANNNQETAAQACIAIQANPCAAQLAIEVKNCGQYRVYYLRPTIVCPSGYCFDLNTPCPAGTSSESGTSPGCSANFPQLPTNLKPTVTPRLGTSTEDPNYEDLRFRCNFTPPNPGHFYDVVWRVNGNEVDRLTKLPAASLPGSGELLETKWKNTYRLGINVECAIRARATSGGTPSPERKSDTFFAGLKALDTAVELKEPETAMIRYQATVPVPCHKLFPCRVRFIDVQHENVGGVCKRNVKGSCGFDVSSGDWNAVRQLKVTAEYDGTFGDRLSEIVLESSRPTLGPKNVWTGVTPQPVIVNIQDTDVRASNKYCQINNDPHFRSFDGRAFDMHLPGEFVLYRHKSLPLEVRGFFQPCGKATCVCGVAVRSGTQIFVWSKCMDNLAYQTSRVRVYGCNKKQMRVNTPDNGSTYKVTLPTGMTVDVNTRGTIRIKPSPADVDKTLGLCGNFNGNKDDEYIDPQGVQHSNDCDFLFLNMPQFCVVNKYGNTWRISDPLQSYYGYPKIDLGTAPAGRCTCTSAQGQVSQAVTCEDVPPAPCGDVDPDVTDQYCTQLGGSSRRRRRRQAGREGDINADVDPVFPSYNITEFLRPQWTNGWTQARARNHCQTFLRRAPAFGACSRVGDLDIDRIVDSCVVDILLSGTTEWSATSLETYKQNCVSEARQNTSLWVSEDGKTPSVLDQVRDVTCPGECSSQGTCVNGTCECDEGRHGDDCSIDVNAPPDVTGLPMEGLCDLRHRECTQTLVYGENFARSNTTLCRFSLPNGSSHTTVAQFRHPGEILCPVPNGRPTNDDVPTAHNVSVTYNSEVFSAPRLFLPYNSLHFRCRVAGLTHRCYRLETTTIRTTPRTHTPLPTIRATSPTSRTTSPTIRTTTPTIRTTTPTIRTTTAVRQTFRTLHTRPTPRCFPAEDKLLRLSREPLAPICPV